MNERSSQEFIKAIAEEIKLKIRSEIDSSGMWSILIDKYKDNSSKAQITFCLWYVKDGQAVERCYKTIESTSQDTETAAVHYIIPMISNMQSSTIIIDAWADGTSVMRGGGGCRIYLLEIPTFISSYNCFCWEKLFSIRKNLKLYTIPTKQWNGNWFYYHFNEQRHVTRIGS